MRVHYQKPKGRALLCCYRCVEVLSGFLFLMLVAAAVTLLRYFLEFSEFTLTYAGNKMGPLIHRNATSGPSSQFTQTEAFKFAKTPFQASATHFTISPQLTEPVRLTIPQSEAWEKMDSPEKPTEKFSPWTSSLPLISVTSLRGLPSATKLRSPHQLLTRSVKWMSPQPLTTAMKETSPGQPASAMELRSLPQVMTAANLMTAMKQTSPGQTTPANKWRSLPQVVTTTNLMFPWPLTTAMKETSPGQPSSAIKFRSFPQIKTVTNLMFPWPLTTAMKETSPGQPASAMELRSLPQVMTAANLMTAMKQTSPGQTTPANKWRSLPQVVTTTNLMFPWPLTTAMKETSPGQPSSAIKFRSFPQIKTVTNLMFPWPLTTAMKETSPGQPSSAIKLRSFPQLTIAITPVPPQLLAMATKQTFLSQPVFAIKSTSLPQPTAAINAMNLMSPQLLTTSQVTSTMKSRPLPQATMVTHLKSSWPLITATKQTPPIRPAAAIKSTSLLQLTTAMAQTSPQSPATELTFPRQQTTAVEPSSPPNLTTASLRQNTSRPWQPFSAQEVSGHTVKNDTSLLVYFKGSFRLVNETYQSNYNDPSTDHSQDEAVKVEETIDNAFAKSALNQRYQGASVLALRPDPFRASFILRFSRSFQESTLSSASVAQEMIRGYQEAQDETRVLVDVESLQVEGYGTLCLVKPSLPPFLLSGESANETSRGGPNGSGKTVEWPWFATVLKDGDPVCEGSMITEAWVLSARSCVEAGDVSVYSVNLGLQTGASDGLYSVTKIIPRPSGAQEDVALIQLAKSAPMTSSTHPICLPDPLQVAPTGADCLALAFKGKGAAKPDVLLWTITSPGSCLLTSSSASTCAQTSDLKRNRQMAAGGSFACPGQNRQPYLEGIVPFSGESQSKIRANSKQRHAAFVRVAPLVPWIKSQLLSRRGRTALP